MTHMIVAIGHDLIEMKKIRGLMAREPERYKRLFHAAELAYVASHQDAAPSLAARFAAKEAFQKVWPRPLSWKDVWVERPHHSPETGFALGAPRLCFAPWLAAEMNAQGLRAHLSLTHTDDHASAVVVLERLE